MVNGRADENPSLNTSTKESGKYQFVKHIGSGSFGQVYSGVDLNTNQCVAIKVEPNTATNPQLLKEFTVYSRYLQNVTGFPNVSHFAQTRHHNYFVMTLLGHNLEYLLSRCGRKFSEKTLFMLADQLLDRLENLHDRSGCLHRDLKPENMMMGRGKSKHILHLVDLGLAKLFIDRKTGEHIMPKNTRRSLVGTARYASPNAHYGKDLSRRDDMESAGYVLVYLGRGKLPWQGVKATNKQERYERIAEIKLRTKSSDLCRGLPQEFQLLMDYVHKLAYAERPDYKLLRGMFHEAMDAKGYRFDDVFDWLHVPQPD